MASILSRLTGSASNDAPNPDAPPPTDPPAAELPAVPEGMAVLLAPDGATGVNFEGVAYEVQNGALVVPAGAVATLTESFGYVAAE